MPQMEASTTSAVVPRPSQYEEDIVQIRTYLERLRADQPEFASNLVAWCEHREMTIQTIEDLHRKIESLHLGCNVVRGAGAVAGIIGIIAGFAGLVLEAKGHEALAEDVKKVGSYCTGGGLVAVTSSTVLEAGLSQVNINKIKNILKRDIALTESLRHTATFSREVELLADRLFQCNIASETFFNVIKVCKHCLQLLNNGQYELDGILRSLQGNKLRGFEDMSLEIMMKVFRFLKGISRNPRLMQPATEICRLLRETTTFEFVRLGVNIYYKAYEVLNIQPLTLILSAANLPDPLAGSTFLVARYAFDTINIGFHVVSIITAIKNIKESKSRYSDALDRVKFALRVELTEVRQQMNAPALEPVRYYDDEESSDESSAE